MTEIIGHRGARALYPENTLAGFQSAVADGVRHFEIDVALTQDGVAVLSHDPRLSPDMTRSAGQWVDDTPVIWRTQAADLARYDVGRTRPGSKTARRFPHQRPVDGAAVPTLADVLALDGEVRWTIELKSYPNRPGLTAPPWHMAEAVAAAADTAGAATRITVQSFDWRGPRHLRRIRPDLAYAWLTTKQTRAWRGGQWALPGAVAAERGGTWSPHFSELTPRLLERARSLGLRVVPWTVNDPAQVARLARWGVDGIITDDPPAAWAALGGAPSSPADPGRN